MRSLSLLYLAYGGGTDLKDIAKALLKAVSGRKVVAARPFFADVKPWAVAGSSLTRRVLSWSLVTAKNGFSQASADAKLPRILNGPKRISQMSVKKSTIIDAAAFHSRPRRRSHHRLSTSAASR